jgi:hypothetical protein
MTNVASSSMSIEEKLEIFLQNLRDAIGDDGDFSNVPDDFIKDVMKSSQVPWPVAKLHFEKHVRLRSAWDLSAWKTELGIENETTTPAAPQHGEPEVPKAKKLSDVAAAVPRLTSLEPYIPAADSKYVRWGENADTVEKVIASRLFCPVYISGHSGNGKTVMIEQACAKAKRQFVRVQITPETDEDDLIGGFRLLAGETVFVEGPALAAMRQGAILMIDELDRGTNKIMCLQGIMEGKPVLVKKTGETVHTAPGFNIIATANTLGRGSDDGRYIAASIIDDAFLERFTVALDQGFPTAAIERKILTRHAESFGLKIEHLDKMLDVLITWANGIRKTFDAGGITDLISTRRLCHIVQMMSLFQHAQQPDKKAVVLCCNRFDPETRVSMVKTYEANRPASFMPAPEAATPPPSSKTGMADEMDALVADVLASSIKNNGD